MLGRLSIRNFQTHEKRVLDLSPKIVTIIGPNDIGKSAIIRALRWLCLNEAPADFVHHGADSARVNLEVDERFVSRIRDDQNHYKLDDQTYTAIRSVVPEEVAKLLNVNELNFQSQHDSPFWFSETAGQISKQLNKIVDLEIIDRTLANLASELRHARSVAELTEDRLRTAREQREATEWVVDFDEKLSKLELKQANLEIKRGSAEGLRFLILQVERHVDYKRNTEEPLVDGHSLLTLAEQALSVEKKRDQLRSLVDQVVSLEERHSDNTKQAELVQDQLNEVESCPLCGQKIQS